MHHTRSTASNTRKVNVCDALNIYRLVQYGSHLGTCPNIFRYCTVNCIMTFLLYSNCLKKMPLLNYILFLLSYYVCEQQNVTYIRFLNYMHLSLKRTSSHKIHTLLIIYGIIKTLKQKRTYDPQLRTIAVALYRIASLLCTCLLHTFS